MEKGSTIYKKDLYWQVAGQEYVLRSVPFFQADYDEEEIIDFDVSIRVTALRDLMFEDELPHDINYETYSDIEF
ncbi:hypothetical protein GCM10011351_17360 [Paraliobacillus quinghaiensis]|uniref:Uncharacterized protein n=1 Tax=Paraliobacillus quinghaiensis TaxID=470815 RepID=A0A917TPB7_9BACI|nr:hypothetical protein [Paraliobacillus quinghaiensis]GGM31697.1 hypothetical protein GCM10011351_17360 [Paraliobacillus quinghaiensis]